MALQKEHMVLPRTNAAVGAGGAPISDVSAPPAPRVPQPARQLRLPRRANSGLTAGAPRRKCHVSPALDCAFLSLLHRDCPYQYPDRGFVKEDHDDVRASLDLTIQELNWFRGIQFGAMLGREGQVGQYVFLRRTHEHGQFQQLEPHLVRYQWVALATGLTASWSS